MMHYLFCGILIFARIYFALGIDPVCKDDEVFNPCPERCTFDPTCEILFQGIRPPCLPPSDEDQCESRCECLPGLARINDDCVSPDKCCEGPNEVSVDCPADCDVDINGEVTKECLCFDKGCRCKPNFARDLQGLCVSIGEQCLGENEIYKNCGTCDGTCDNPNPRCLQVCRPGCYCQEDHVRQNGTCIPINACSCKPHEVYNSCGTCDGTCSIPDPICTQACVAGCFCVEGYVRDVFGKCVDLYLCDDDDDPRPRRFGRRRNTFRRRTHRPSSIGSVIRWLKSQITFFRKYCSCPQLMID